MRKPYIKGSNCALFSWNAPDNVQLPYLEAYNALFVFYWSALKGTFIDISNHFLALCKCFVCYFSKSLWYSSWLVNFHMNFSFLMMSPWHLEHGHSQNFMPSTALQMPVWWQRLGIMHAISLEPSECDFSVKEGLPLSKLYRPSNPSVHSAGKLWAHTLLAGL